jgi:hypothetical protein
MNLTLLGQVLAGLAPTVGVAVLFYIAVRAIIRADAGEREADRQFSTSPSPPRPDNRDAASGDDD